METRNIPISVLVHKVKSGEIKLPEMQRPYVWKATQVRDLLDSLYRGYPSGNILVWEADERVETREVAVESVEKSPISQKYLLLDGQQRATSLAALLTGEYVNVRGRSKPIDLLFNLEHPNKLFDDVVAADDEDLNRDEDIDDDSEELETNDEQRKITERRTFEVFNSALNASPYWVRVSDIFRNDYKETVLLRSVGINSDDSRWDKYSNRLQKLRGILDYNYVMHVLPKGMPYEEVTEVFVRVNSKGARLRASDLALAQITSKWHGFLQIFEDFTEKFGDSKQAMVDTNIPIRAMIVFATKQCKFRNTGAISLERLQDAWETSKEGMEYAFNFMRDNARIDNLQKVSSPLSMIPIAVYWIEKQKNGDGVMTRQEQDKLLQWFYAAHMRQHYSGSSETKLDADLHILFKTENREEILDKLIERLYRQVGRFGIDPEDLERKHTGHPLFVMLGIVMKQQGIKDWHSRLELSYKNIGSEHQIEKHHIFPKSLLEKKQYNKYEINEIANFTFLGGGTNRRILNQEPRIYFQELLEQHGEEALTSHFIPLGKNLWELDNYREFLQYRREKIAEEINKFVGSYT